MSQLVIVSYNSQHPLIWQSQRREYCWLVSKGSIVVIIMVMQLIVELVDLSAAYFFPFSDIYLPNKLVSMWDFMC